MPLLYFDYVKTADFGSEKKNFSITIFHEKKLPFSVAPFILPLKHSNRAFEALPGLQKAKICQMFVTSAVVNKSDLTLDS